MDAQALLAAIVVWNAVFVTVGLALVPWVLRGTEPQPSTRRLRGTYHQRKWNQWTEEIR